MCSWQLLLFLLLCAYAIRCDDINGTTPSQEVSQESKDDTILNLLEKLDALMTIFDARAYRQHSYGTSDIDDSQKAVEHQGLTQEGGSPLPASVKENGGTPVEVRADYSSLSQKVNGSVEQNDDGGALKMESSESEMIERLLSDDENAWTKPMEPFRPVATSEAFREATQNYQSESGERQSVQPTRGGMNMTDDQSEGSSERDNDDNRKFRAIVSSSRVDDSSSGEIIEEEEELYRLVNQKFKSEVLYGPGREAFMRRLCAGCWKKGRKPLVSSPSTTKEPIPETATIPPSRSVEESVTIAQGDSSQPTIDQATNSWPSGTLSTQTIGSELGLTFEAKQFETNATSPIFLANGRSEDIPPTLPQQQYNPVAEGSKANTTEHFASGTDVVPLTKTEEVDRGENALVTETTIGILNENMKGMQTPVSGGSQEGSHVQPTSADVGVSVANPNLSEKLIVPWPETTSLAFRNITSAEETHHTLGSLASPKEGETVGVTIDNEGERFSGIDGTLLSKQEPTTTFETKPLAETVSGESPAAFPEVKEQEMRRPDVGTTVSIFEPNVIEESYSVEEDSPLVSSSMGSFLSPDSPISSEATAHMAQTEAQPLLEPHNTAGTAPPPMQSFESNFDASGQQVTQLKEETVNTNPSSLDKSGMGSQSDAKIEQPQLVMTTFNLPTVDSASMSTESVDGFEPDNSDLLGDTDLVGSSAQKVESGGGSPSFHGFSNATAVPDMHEANISSSLSLQESSDGSGNVTYLENTIVNASKQSETEGSGLSSQKPTLQSASKEEDKALPNSDAADIMLSLLEPSRTSTAATSRSAYSTDHPTIMDSHRNLSTPAMGNNNQSAAVGSTSISNGTEMGRFDISPLPTTSSRSLTENDVIFEGTSTVGWTDGEAANKIASQAFGHSDVTEASPSNEIVRQVVNSSDNLLAQKNQLDNGSIVSSIEGAAWNTGTPTPSLAHPTILPSLGLPIANGIANNEVISNNGNLENSTLPSPSLEAGAHTVRESASVGLNTQVNKESLQVVNGPDATPDVVTGNVVESEKTNSVSSFQQPSLNWSSGIQVGTTALPQAAGEERFTNFSNGTIVSVDGERASPSTEPKGGTNGNELEEKGFNVATVPAIATHAQHSIGSVPVPQQEINPSGSINPLAGSASLSPSVTINPETGNPIFWAPSGPPLTGQTVSAMQSSKAHLQSFSHLYRPGAVSRRVISDRNHKVNWNSVLRQLGFFNPEKLESAINGTSQPADQHTKAPPAITVPPKELVTLSNGVDKEIGDNLIGISEQSSSSDVTVATFPTTTERNGLQKLTPLVSSPREHDIHTTATTTTIGAAIMTGNELGFNGPTTSPELDDVAETVDDVIDELRLANSFSRPEVFPFETFTGKSPHLCATELHPILAIFKLLKRRGIYQLYKNTQCEIDYHIHCKYSWKYCDSFEALTFCPKTCRDTNCTRLKQYGYNEVETPVYLTQCIDTKAHDCPALSARGDCFTNPHSMAFLCPDSCKFCAIDEQYLPFMPEAEKLVVWLQTYRNGHYKAYAEYVHSRVVLLHAKAKKGIC
ncbi:shTK domain protein [Trichuris suis]|nr:shTK domain protein [Trichuris suis]